MPPRALFTFAPPSHSDRNCEHYTRAWVLDCVLSVIVYQLTALGVDDIVCELAPPPAEALATALSEVGLDAAATLSCEEEEAMHVAARDERRHREVLQESLAMDSQDSDSGSDSDAGMPGLLDPDGRTAATRTHAPSTGPSGATT